MPFRAGDIVKHRPSGETWVLACDEDDRAWVLPAGWPESLAVSVECDLLTAATDVERSDMLREVAKGTGYRASVARNQLALPIPPRETDQ